jgi:hypothetical protein
VYYSINLNLYHYAGLNPIRLIDPDGRCSEAAYEAAGKDVFGRDLRYSGALQRYPDAEGIVAITLAIKAIGVGTIIKFIQDAFSEKGSGENKDKQNIPYTPDRNLPKDKHGNKKPESDAPHTQLGRKTSKRTSERYPQTREWSEKGNRGYNDKTPLKDTDWTDHDRPSEHTKPHDHKYDQDTGKRLKSE